MRREWGQQEDYGGDGLTKYAYSGHSLLPKGVFCIKVLKGFPFVWDEIPVVVTFESDWEEAEKLLLEKAEVEADKIERQVKLQIKRMQNRYAIRYKHLTPTVYTSITDNGVKVTLRYLCPVRERRAMTHRLSRNILQAFINHPRIDFAYPTPRIFRNDREGKPDIGGPTRK